MVIFYPNKLFILEVLYFIIDGYGIIFNMDELFEDDGKFKNSIIRFSNSLSKSNLFVVGMPLFKKYSIIPNYISETEFPFYERPNDQANNVLIIRSFASRKYANDISMKVINRLSNKEYFHNMIFDIYGTGKYFKKLTSKVSNFDNVHIYETSLNHTEIYELHKRHGIFLCPTRQDAQGVSMCEAMSSGCVPITSNSTAIPEFVSDKEGFLCDNNCSYHFSIKSVCTTVRIQAEDDRY